MEWATASVIIAAIVGLAPIIIVAILQFVPRKGAIDMQQVAQELQQTLGPQLAKQFATKAEHDELAARVTKTEAAIPIISERLARMEVKQDAAVEVAKRMERGVDEVRSFLMDRHKAAG
jgi:hypothetical protein